MANAPPPLSCTVLGSAVHVVKLSTWSVLNRRFFCPTALAQKPFPWNLLAWLAVQVLFNQMDMPICPLKSQIAGSTGYLDPCTLCGALWSTAALQRQPPAAPATGCTSQNHFAGAPCLFYTWEFPHSVDNKDPSGNEALTHPLCVHRDLQSWVVLTAPS